MLATTWNIVLNGLTLGRYVWLEGRVRAGVFRNWGRHFAYRPRRFARPTSEAEVAELIADARRIRVCGSGHSFNSGIVSSEVLVSLDRYAGVVRRDPDRRRMTVRGGTRVRDIVAALSREGWAFSALPSHDAQSIAGILSTDVHGTGRSWGFVSEHVVGLRIMDGCGNTHDVTPEDDLFRAAIGGIGATGIILEVTVEAVPRFRVAQRVKRSNLDIVERELDRMHDGNEHFSLYLFPFTRTCQINTWNSTEEREDRFGSLREWGAISLDALLAAWFGNAAAYLGLLPYVSSWAHGLKRGTNLVLESSEAFNRTIYHLHQELEFTVPYREALPSARRFIELYETIYREAKLPYTLFEIRFTPEGHERALIGPGRDRRCAWIDLVCNDSSGFERYYAAAEELVREIGARPHLGKYGETLTATDLERLYGTHFDRFRRLMREHDPHGRFSNAFTERVFGPVAEARS